MYKEFFVIIYLSYDMVSKARISQKGVLPPPPPSLEASGAKPPEPPSGLCSGPTGGLKAAPTPSLLDPLWKNPGHDTVN